MLNICTAVQRFKQINLLFCQPKDLNMTGVYVLMKLACSRGASGLYRYNSNVALTTGSEGCSPSWISTTLVYYTGWKMENYEQQIIPEIYSNGYVASVWVWQTERDNWHLSNEGMAFILNLYPYGGLDEFPAHFSIDT